MRRKKEHLVPLEKSKKIIYLEKRGRGQNKSVGAVIFGILGIGCLLYCLSIALFIGYGTKFFLAWGGLAAAFGMVSLVLAHREWVAILPHWFKICFTVCAVAAVLFFTAVEGLIFSGFGAKAQPGADYVVVLGAQWKQSGPSYVLQKRLDTAAEYLQQNPETVAVVSGGQGSNEPISEALGMKEYLIKAGISQERIIMEDQSTNTYENLLYSGLLLDKGNARVVIVTNNFHIFRAVHIAQKQGYRHTEGLAAPSFPGMLPNNLLREFFGVVKDFLVGNL